MYWEEGCGLAVRAPNNLIQTLRSTETCRASTDNEDINVAVSNLSVPDSIVETEGHKHVCHCADLLAVCMRGGYILYREGLTQGLR